MSSRTEQTQYTVLEFKKGYEIRSYPSHIVAQTTVQGSYQRALSQGFRIVAGYIFGGNISKQRIAMTAPVVAQKQSVSIAMTAPVVAGIEGDSHIIAFGMPRSYTLSTLPTPTDYRVKIVTIPKKKMAVIRFSWMRTDVRVHAKTHELLDALKKDHIVAIGEPQYAEYDAPWTLPWMKRHEVMIEIK